MTEKRKNERYLTIAVLISTAAAFISIINVEYAVPFIVYFLGITAFGVGK